MAAAMIGVIEDLPTCQRADQQAGADQRDEGGDQRRGAAVSRAFTFGSRGSGEKKPAAGWPRACA